MFPCFVSECIIHAFIEYIVFQNCQRFCRCFVFIDCYTVIFAICIFQNQCRTRYSTIDDSNCKLSATFRNSKFPSFRYCNWRHATAAREICYSPLCVVNGICLNVIVYIVMIPIYTDFRINFFLILI